MMDTYSKNRAADRNNVGRPIIVYDDDSGEQNNDTSNSSSGIIFIILLRFILSLITDFPTQFYNK